MEFLENTSEEQHPFSFGGIAAPPRSVAQEKLRNSMVFLRPLQHLFFLAIQVFAPMTCPSQIHTPCLLLMSQKIRGNVGERKVGGAYASFITHRIKCERNFLSASLLAERHVPVRG